MTVTAIVVMNHENKLTTTKNPLLRVKEVEALIATYTVNKNVFIDSCQFDLRIDQCKEAEVVFAVVDEGCEEVDGVENLHPKSAEILIKHFYKHPHMGDVAVFASPDQLKRLKGYVDQILIVTINNQSKELVSVDPKTITELSAKKLSVTTWSVRQSEEEHNRRYTVKIYS